MVDLSISKPKSQKENYLSTFESFEKGIDRKTPAWIHQVRKSAIDRFRTLGFPTMREENWKYTNVGPIAETPFKFASDFNPSALSVEKIKPFLFSQNNWQRLVFVNGFYSKELSYITNSKNG